jgi:hypothetical protein
MPDLVRVEKKPILNRKAAWRNENENHEPNMKHGKHDTPAVMQIGHRK